MKTIKREINLYKFDELEKDIQEKILEREIQSSIDCYCENELELDLEEYASKLLEKYFKNKAELKNIYYDFSYSQGSGAMIEFDLEYYNNFLEIKHNNNFYCHEKTFTIIGEISNKRYSILYEKIININKELVKYGYSILEDEKNWKQFTLETIKDMLFLENGDFYGYDWDIN